MKPTDNSENVRLQAIAETILRNRNRMEFVRGGVFLAAACIAGLMVAAEFVARRLLPGMNGIVGWLMWFPAVVIGATLLVFYRDKHRTVTLTDRSIINVWLYASGVCLASAFYTDPIGLPVAGFLTIGMSIAVAFTSELFRRYDTNKSNQSGTLVILNGSAGVGAFLAAWIFRAAHDGETTAQFILTLVAVALLLGGTGLVLRYNERRNRV